MKILIAGAMLFFCSCANSSNEAKEDEIPVTSPSSAIVSDTTNLDTMMQPNGVSNGTVILDTGK